ncbi:hypothetical protein NE857_26805 [Nocardiopsis exhalans]|uniref:DUF4365 domain-containing protein n=1 Tax=Nocardiopsis exhalans TaxID=163604 RepID=A0ABY5D6Z4_9ACTN|nr:hypothetical protein [Nocardiopsis exhalans]USY18853.1 hypothetical protein NE857_26805 [Nocardiopsis exhalans]
MPGQEHEIPLKLVQNQPAMAPVLLESLGFDIPHHTEAINTSSVLTNCDPKELNSDGAVLLRDGARHVMAVVVERQNGRDYEKRLTWPAYLSLLRLRLKCPAVLVVLCPTGALARWCATPIQTGHPGFDLSPLTIGPAEMPLIVDHEQARALPELAVLSARAHGDTDTRTLEAVLEALDATANKNRAFYYDYVLAGLKQPRGDVHNHRTAPCARSDSGKPRQHGVDGAIFAEDYAATAATAPGAEPRHEARRLGPSIPGTRSGAR